MRERQDGGTHTRNRAIFLDRDGTLIEDKGYICHFREAELFSFSIPALKKINEHHFQAIVITNQSSIARGICTERQVRQVHRDLDAYFHARGARIDAFYFSPYHEDGKIKKYRKKDDSRKPGPGMILQAARDLNIDLESSWIIGDSSKDIIAGKNAGCRTMLVLTGNGKPAQRELDMINLIPDLIGENLLDGVEKIFSIGI